MNDKDNKTEDTIELIGVWCVGIDSEGLWYRMAKEQKFGPKFDKAFGEELKDFKKDGLSKAHFHNAASDMDYMVTFKPKDKAYRIEVKDSPSAQVSKEEKDAIAATEDFRRYVAATSYFIKRSKDMLDGLVREKITDGTIKADELAYEDLVKALDDVELIKNLSKGKVQ